MEGSIQIGSVAEARRVLRAVFPALAPVRLRRLGEGWDTTAFLADETIVFRFPRHVGADRALGMEVALLAEIGRLLPVSVPDYRYVAGPSAAFRWRVAGYPFLPGSPLRAAEAADARRLSSQLAGFLAALHAVAETLLPLDLPRYSPGDWLEHHEQLVAGTLPLIQTRAPALGARLEKWWDRYLRDERAVAFTPRLVHGDLVPEHLLLDSQGNLAGVIDFGDAMLADPALDLAGLPPPLFARVLAHYSYGERDELAVRCDAYRRLAPLHAVEAAGRLGRPELLDAGLRELESQLAHERARYEPG